MIAVILPDDSARTLASHSTGTDLAEQISKRLAKEAVAIKINGELCDLYSDLQNQDTVEIITRNQEEGVNLLRHDAAHVLAQAVKELFPETQVTIGPVINNGFYYDFSRETPFIPEDLITIEKRMCEIVERDLPIRREVWQRERAIEFFQQIGEHYKSEIIAEIPAGESISLYRQGDFIDLCRGPHLPSTKKLGQAFKLMKIAGAYWRGDSTQPMLQRIYGTAWADEKSLKNYLKQLEEAEKRDHRKLGKEMNLFHFQEEAPGAIFWHPKGWHLFQGLITYMRNRQNEGGYLELNTPELMDLSLWKTSGHWVSFGQNMFTAQTKEERVFAIKPMNCPGHVQVFKQGMQSYRDLPVRFSEFGKVHRYEPSGTLHGLMRVRAFTQDDAHIFCTQEQITEESVIVCNLILSIYRDFGFEEVYIKYADRPQNRVGDDEIWDQAEASLQTAVEKIGLEYTKNPGEGAFYGPKLEFVLRDAIGRDWQCGTLQVDLNLPGRLGAYYIDENSQKKTPVMLHRALFGSLERFTGILLEHYAGHLPFWLAPTQVAIATIITDVETYAREVQAQLQQAGIQTELDIRNEKIGYKVREHSLQKTPVILAIGRREASERTVTIRRLGVKTQVTQPLEKTIAQLKEENQPPSSNSSF